MNSTDTLGDLVIDLYKNLKTRVERDLKEYEIGMGQLQILMVFFNDMERSFAQNELANVVGVDKGNISRSLLKLSAKAYLKRDEGTKQYALSEKGRQLKTEIISIFININALMTNEIKPKHIDRTIRTLARMNKNLEESI